MKSLNQRLKAVQSQILLEAAQQVKEDLLSRIPGKKDYAAYKKGIQIGLIKGLSGDIPTYALFVPKNVRSVRKTDVWKTLMYVQTKKKFGRSKPQIEILERFSPWTMDTIPFVPKRDEAVVLTRRVSPGEVDKVKKARDKDKVEWKNALAKIGFRVKQSKKLTIPKKIKTLPDVAFEALNLEFGLGGTKAKAHWRPAVLDLMHGGLRSISKERKFKRAVSDAGFTAWRKWPAKLRYKLPLQMAKDFVPFQKKLGIKPSGG